MAVVSKGVSLLTVTPASTRLPGSFLQRKNFASRLSPVFFHRWSDATLRSSSCSAERSPCPRKNNAFFHVRRFSGFFFKAEKRKLKIGAVLRLNEEEESSAEGLQRGSAEYRQKIWMRKQTGVRAPGLETVVRSTYNEGGDPEGNAEAAVRKRWFPHVDAFEIIEGTTVSSGEIMELLDPFLSEERKQRIENVINNRTFSVCTVVEGLSDVGNVSAICRTADAMGFQAVHVISHNHRVRYRENHRTSAGAEKWLDMENWDDTQSCIQALKARGYRIAVTHIAEDTVSIHDMDWTTPTAIVLGNEHRGISEEAIALSDLRCSIPMAGMVESFNVSVAAAIVMHHAQTDRISRQGSHGDLSEEERRILLADFYMRHRDDTKDILRELVDRKFAREGLRMT